MAAMSAGPLFHGMRFDLPPSAAPSSWLNSAGNEQTLLDTTHVVSSELMLSVISEAGCKGTFVSRTLLTSQGSSFQPFMRTCTKGDSWLVVLLLNCVASCVSACYYTTPPTPFHSLGCLQPAAGIKTTKLFFFLFSVLQPSVPSLSSGSGVRAVILRCSCMHVSMLTCTCFLPTVCCPCCHVCCVDVSDHDTALALPVSHSPA